MQPRATIATRTTPVCNSTSSSARETLTVFFFKKKLSNNKPINSIIIMVLLSRFNAPFFERIVVTETTNRKKRFTFLCFEVFHAVHKYFVPRMPIPRKSEQVLVIDFVSALFCYRRRRRSTAARILRSLCHHVCVCVGGWVCMYVC